jgi:flagellin-specific chaperone FliS
MSEDIRTELRQLMMLISDIRSKDSDRYEEHIKFSNEVVAFIKNIQESMNNNWSKIQTSMESLSKSIENSLDSLLTGINPEGLKETSKSLKEIIDTMGKSIQSLNLENVMQELRGVSPGAIKITAGPAAAAGSAAPAAAAGSRGAPSKPLKAGMSSTYTSAGAAPAAGAAPSAVNSAALANLPEDEQWILELPPAEQEEILAAKEVYGYIPPHLKKKAPKKKKQDTNLLKPSDFFGS